METTIAEKLPKPIVYANASLLVNKIVDERKDVGEKMCIKVACDGSFSNACISIFPKKIFEGHGTFPDDNGSIFNIKVW